MIGMPRITLIRLALRPDRILMPETRIIAQISPRTVESSNDPMVTTIVSTTPLSRIGKNSTASCQKPFIGRSALQAPFVEDLVHRPIRFQLGKRGVDLALQPRLALAHADADRADRDGLVAGNEARFGE